MGFRQMLLARKFTLIRDSRLIWGVVPKDLHPLGTGMDEASSLLAKTEAGLRSSSVARRHMELRLDGL
jgi:hypothetical protein